MTEMKNDIPYISFDENSITDQVLKELFYQAKSAVIKLEVYELLRLLCESQGIKEKDNPGVVITKLFQKRYDRLRCVSVGIAQKINGRVTITLPDGHVIIDTCKGEGNTCDNYVDDVISENHNSRPCIFQAQYDYRGVSYERKFSSTTFRKEVYLAIRLGPFRNSVGTIRLSIPDS